MTPSRSAHGQISSSARSKMSMHRLGDQRARHDLVGPARRDARAGRRARRASIVDAAWGSTRAGRRAAACAATSGALAGRRRAADPGQRAERLRGRRRVVGRARRAAAWPASRAISARICLRSSRIGLVVGRPVAEVARGPAGPRRAAATRRRRAPRRRRRRSPASRRRCRRPPAGPADQPNQRRTARKVSRASSSPGSTSIVDAGALARRGRGRRRSCAASRTAEVAKPSISSQPLSSATTERVGDEVGERVDARAR